MGDLRNAGAVRTGRVTVLSVSAMTVSMVQLYILGALGPVLVRELRIAPWLLGVLVAAGFAVAAALSVPAGSVVDRWGPRRCLAGLFALAALALAVLAMAANGWWVLVAVLLGSLPQALANPATNKIIAGVVPTARRGSVTGWKQSGVQVGAFLAGLPLSWLAAVAGWRVGVAALAVLAAVAAVATAGLPAVSSPSTRVPARAVFGGRVGLLAVFSVALGAGLSSVNTYLSLYGHVVLGLSDTTAGALVAVLGVAGIAGRVGWSRRAGRLGDPALLLPWLGGGAGAAALVVSLAAPLGAVLVWLGAVGVGVFGVAANAVSMVVVMRAVPPAAAGRAAAVVSAGFFTGFAVGPAGGGALASWAGYGWLWTAVIAAFAGSAAVGLAAARTRHPAPVPA